MRNSTQWISMWKLRKLTILNFSLNIHWILFTSIKSSFHILTEIQRSKYFVRSQVQNCLQIAYFEYWLLYYAQINSNYNVAASVVDPYHFDTDPDSGSEQKILRIRIQTEFQYGSGSRQKCFQPQENLKNGFKKRLFQLPCVFILFSNSYNFIRIRIQPQLMIRISM